MLFLDWRCGGDALGGRSGYAISQGMPEKKRIFYLRVGFRASAGEVAAEQREGIQRWLLGRGANPKANGRIWDRRSALAKAVIEDHATRRCGQLRRECAATVLEKLCNSCDGVG